MKKNGLIIALIGILFVIASFVLTINNREKKESKESKEVIIDESKDDEYEFTDTCINDYYSASLKDYEVTIDNKKISFKHLPCLKEMDNKLSPNSKLFGSPEGGFVIQFDIIESNFDKVLVDSMNIRNEIWESFEKMSIRDSDENYLLNPNNYETVYRLYSLTSNEEYKGQLALYGVKLNDGKMLIVHSYTKDGVLEDGFYITVFDSLTIND